LTIFFWRTTSVRNLLTIPLRNNSAVLLLLSIGLTTGASCAGVKTLKQPVDTVTAPPLPPLEFIITKDLKAVYTAMVSALPDDRLDIASSSIDDSGKSATIVTARQELRNCSIDPYTGSDLVYWHFPELKKQGRRSYLERYAINPMGFNEGTGDKDYSGAPINEIRISNAPDSELGNVLRFRNGGDFRFYETASRLSINVSHATTQLVISLIGQQNGRTLVRLKDSTNVTMWHSPGKTIPYMYAPPVDRKGEWSSGAYPTHLNHKEILIRMNATLTAAGAGAELERVGPPNPPQAETAPPKLR
jgi:hypothetical protein